MAQNDTIDPKIQLQPLMCTYLELYVALAPLHLHNKVFADRLHDAWKVGAPSPDSIILNPKGYDPRKRQVGNFEKRLVLPGLLVEWARDVCAWRGMQVTDAELWKMVLAE